MNTTFYAEYKSYGKRFHSIVSWACSPESSDASVFHRERLGRVCLAFSWRGAAPARHLTGSVLVLTLALPGPGGNTTARASIEHLLTASEASEFTVDKVFLGHPTWIDYGYV